MTLPPEITTVLFDMDGVLIDSSAAVRAGYSQWAEANGFDPDEVMSIVHGRRTVEVVREFGFDGDPDGEADRLERSIAERATIDHGIEASCEVFQLLDPARIAVATSARRETALSNLRVLMLREPRVLVTGQDVESGKPAPDPYLLAADRLGANPDECVVIEDSPAGINAGHAAGMHVIGLLTTHDPQEIDSADQLLAPEELREALGGLIK